MILDFVVMAIIESARHCREDLVPYHCFIYSVVFDYLLSAGQYSRARALSVVEYVFWQLELGSSS